MCISPSADKKDENDSKATADAPGEHLENVVFSHLTE